MSQRPAPFGAAAAHSQIEMARKKNGSEGGPEFCENPGQWGTFHRPAEKRCLMGL